MKPINPNRVFPEDRLRSKAHDAEELIRELYNKLPEGVEKAKCKAWLLTHCGHKLEG